MRPSIGARNSVYSLSRVRPDAPSPPALTEACAFVGLRALVVGLLGDGLVVHQLLAACEVGLGEGEIGPRLRQIGAHLVERDLKRPLVDGEQEIALLHHLAVREMNSVR